MDYIPLQILSSYTLLNSTVSIPSLIEKAKTLGYKTIALTDRNVMHGAIEFYQEAKKHGIKPIIGLTLDITLERDSDSDTSIVLLAKNETGYQSLLKLSTLKMHDKQRIYLNDLKKYSSDLIAILASQTNAIKSSLENSKELNQLLTQYKKALDKIYVGVNLQQTSIENVNLLKEQASELSLPLVVNEPVDYLNKEEAPSLKVLKAIGNQDKLNYEELTIEEQSRYLKSKETVTSTYFKHHLNDAVNNTTSIADQINLEFNWQSVLPKFSTPGNISSKDYLNTLVNNKLVEKVPSYTQEYKERIDKELTVINKMGFADYFLIVWDLMQYAHKRNIVTGSGRGSAAGSLVSYVLNITDVDPVQYDLLFDRFLNEERASLPDIDLDFPDNKREIILNYVLNKYGKDHVAQIATFGSFAAKMALRDTGRVLGLEQSTLKEWANAIPSQLGITLNKAYKQSKALRNLVNSSDLNKTLFDIALSLEGLPRHVSTHAAGVVISKNPLVHSTPLQEGNSHLPLTQFAMDDIETVGLLKMDFLGLKNLTILSDCLTNTPELSGTIKEKLNAIPLDDTKTLELFKKGDTDGIFQFESRGIQNVLKKLGASTFEDVVAVNALYRPGPMEQIDTYVARKKGTEEIEYVHDDLKDIVKVTYGIMVYQEQVMKVAARIAGYTLAEADILRRAISKKIKTEIDAGRKQFVAGANQRGYSKKVATEIYNHIEKFANYGFNRSHAVSYSKLAYQLAYFKAHYPAAFFVSIMKATSINKEKVKRYILEAKQRGIEIKSPNINESETSFSVKDQKISFGFDSIKGLRKDFIYHIINERKSNGPFKDLLSFITRIGEKWKKEALISQLIYAGCFDELGQNRQTLIHSLVPILNSVTMSKGNVELFESLAPKYVEKEDFSLEEKLELEFEATGFYLSGHPTETYDSLRENNKVDYLTVSENNQESYFIVSINNVKRIQTKRGEPMAFVEVADSSGEATCVMFPSVYRQYGKILNENAVLFVKGKTEWKKNQLNVLVTDIALADTIQKEKSKMVYLRFMNLDEQKEAFSKVLSVLTKHGGQSKVLIYDQMENRKELLKKNYNISPTQECIEELKKILGKENVYLK